VVRMSTILGLACCEQLLTPAGSFETKDVQGCEVVRMYETILGREGSGRVQTSLQACHDARQAVTCDDFLLPVVDANDEDLPACSAGTALALALTSCVVALTSCGAVALRRSCANNTVIGQVRDVVASMDTAGRLRDSSSSMAFF
jgi:hypothetical protein